MGIALERMAWGAYTPAKVKLAVSGCPRNCAESTIKGFGMIAADSGWELSVGGNGGIKPRATEALCKVEAPEQVLEHCGAFLQLCREQARYLERVRVARQLPASRRQAAAGYRPRWLRDLSAARLGPRQRRGTRAGRELRASRQATERSSAQSIQAASPVLAQHRAGARPVAQHDAHRPCAVADGAHARAAAGDPSRRRGAARPDAGRHGARRHPRGQRHPALRPATCDLRPATCATASAAARDDKRGVLRLGALQDGRLLGCLFLAREPARLPAADEGRQVCACFGVGLNAIRHAVATHRLRDAAVGAHLKAGDPFVFGRGGQPGRAADPPRGGAQPSPSISFAVIG